jgi:hypothetical protein
VKDAYETGSDGNPTLYEFAPDTGNRVVMDPTTDCWTQIDGSGNMVVRYQYDVRHLYWTETDPNGNVSVYDNKSNAWIPQAAPAPVYDRELDATGPTDVGGLGAPNDPIHATHGGPNLAATAWHDAALASHVDTVPIQISPSVNDALAAPGQSGVATPEGSHSFWDHPGLNAYAPAADAVTSSFARTATSVDNIASHFHPDWGAVNPQPLPPGPDPEAALHGSDLVSQVLKPGVDSVVHNFWNDVNPQPLPPGPDPEMGGHASPWSNIISAVDLNRQPLPPGPDPESAFHGSESQFLKTGMDPAAHAILADTNPQPFAPGSDAHLDIHSDPAATVALNPQPLPPAPEPLHDYGVLSVPTVHDYPLH